MTLKECYSAIGGDYDSVIKRLMTEALVKKFMLKFLDDPSYTALIDSLDAKNYDEAFRAAHTIKGICQNLDFTKLFNSVAPLTEELRGGNAPSSPDLIKQVTKDYQTTVSAIKELNE